MENSKPAIKISVSKIVEMVMRCGDIDSRFADPSAMHKGAAAHRKIQKKQKEMQTGYEQEVSLRHEIEIDGITIILQGRADGIITDADGKITIDEIKSSTMPLELLTKLQGQHLAQGKCYAYMLLQTLENPPEAISVQLTYFQLESEETQRQTWEFADAELAGFFNELIEGYAVWLRLERDLKITRDESIELMRFPYDTYRKGQREIAVAVYHAIREREKLYVSAPTGIGKTLSTLFPSIKALGKGNADKLFYLTAKTVARVVAEDAVRQMAERGLRLKHITLRAKEKICQNSEKTVCNPDSCAYAKGHYDRINDAILDILENCDIIIPDVTVEYAKKHRVCPHEYALDASLYCDLVVGDYNHVFDPVVYLQRFFGGEAGSNGDHIFLIDEAHNLAERVRDMYSVSLDKRAFADIRKELKDKDTQSKDLKKTLRDIGAHYTSLRKEHEETKVYVAREQDRAFAELVEAFSFAAGQWLNAKKASGHSLHEDILNLYFETSRYLLISQEMYDETFYANITEITSRTAYITLFCLNPSSIIAGKLDMARASVIFSATLQPLPYYRDILGGGEGDRAISLPSPFDTRKLLVMAHAGISTKYVDRESSYAPIVSALNAAVSHKMGNYMCFFPSYEYMHKVHELFCQEFPDVATMMQTGSMTEQEREGFLARFDADNKETLVGFVVLGGVFSEGIDLKGDRLIGSIIVSVGIPKISLRQDLIRGYYDQENGLGYDYAYTFPGMNKVLQAAGRVIRTEQDAGIVMLIDSRYDTAKYRGIMPPHWDNVRVVRNLVGVETTAGSWYNYLEGGFDG
ncbi:MAG: PD-(D/E)XK nuclease family protein [Defluviitaleaceae bacterium]|nr:PD-(D/E)XK nuclease family protein [Defluviitaleaceae bacterium]